MSKRYDLIVAGGGFAGVSAALAASRRGCSVLLIDKAGCLGGAAANCLINPFMTTRLDEERFYFSRGIFSEIVNELDKRDAFGIGNSFSEEDLKLIFNRMILASNIDLLLHSTLYDVEKEGKTLKAVWVFSKGGRQKYEADCFIDATGDADLAVLSGCATQLGREDNLCQPMTLCFRITNVEWEEYIKHRDEIKALYVKFREDGKIKNPREDMLIFPNPIHNVLHFNSTRIVKRNPVDPVDLTRAEVEAREQVYEILDFLKENFPLFKDSSIAMTASEIGVRESRMLVGRYVLTGKDLLACKKFDDAIAACNYDIDIHNPEGTGTSHHYFEKGAYYTIPYRSLQALEVDNLLVSGRCLSSDHEAQASYRIMPTCSNTGEAAGVAAAIAVQDGVKPTDADIKKIQGILKENGAFIGI